MADDKKLEILISTKGDASGAQQVTDALKETAEAAKAASSSQGTGGGANDSWKAEHAERMAALDKEREAKEKAEKADERTARSTDRMDMRGQVENAANLARGLQTAANTAREYADAIEASNPAMAETARKTADVAQGVGGILEGAAQGFAAGGPVGAAFAAIGAAAKYMFDGLEANAKATADMEAALIKANNASAEAERLAGRKAREATKAAEAAYEQKKAEEELTASLHAEVDAMRELVEQTREKNNLADANKSDEQTVIRAKAAADRAANEASNGSEEEKARRAAEIDAKERAALREQEDKARSAKEANLDSEAKSLGGALWRVTEKGKAARQDAEGMPKGSDERTVAEKKAEGYEQEAKTLAAEIASMRREMEDLKRADSLASRTRPLEDSAAETRSNADIIKARERDESRKEQEARRKEQEDERAAREAERAETQAHAAGANAQSAAKGARDVAGVKGMPLSARRQLEAAASALENGDQGGEMAKFLAMVDRLADLAAASKNTPPEVKRKLAELEAKIAKLDSQNKANRS